MWAAFKIGDEFRTAALVKDSSEAVGGVIVARTGENAQEVIDRVKQKIEEIEPGPASRCSYCSFL